MASTRGKYPRYTSDPELEARLRAEAGGQCPVCLKKRRLVVHHCHASGKIEAVLCDQCNRALGLLGDMASRLRRALELIEHPPAKALRAKQLKDAA